MTEMPAAELRQWLRQLDYQQRLILWALAHQNPKNKIPMPQPPEGITHNDPR